MKIIIGNFKMNLMMNEIEEYLAYFQKRDLTNVYFAPSTLYLHHFITKNLKAGSQDVSFANVGAYTGDISASQLKSIGATFSLVGHSERRKYYHDSQFVNEKIKRLRECNLDAILCIGEEKEERMNHQVFDVLKKEIDEAFENISINDLKNIIIAYEPIWSIGTGLVPTNDEILEVISFIKKYVYDHYHVQIRVLYGGSVNNKNIDTLEKIQELDGYLVGGCSISKEDFLELIMKVHNNE